MPTWYWYVTGGRYLSQRWTKTAGGKTQREQLLWQQVCIASLRQAPWPPHNPRLADSGLARQALPGRGGNTDANANCGVLVPQQASDRGMRSRIMVVVASGWAQQDLPAAHGSDGGLGFPSRQVHRQCDMFKVFQALTDSKLFILS
jgi:hypothetical protein